MSDTKTPLLEVRGMSKRFPGVRALHEVSLTLGHGEVLAVLGENGAGKSTLMKILAGVQPADSGELLLDGKAVIINSVQAALDHHVALIHQELNLADNLSVAANIYLGRELLKFGLLDRQAMMAGTRVELKKVGLEVTPGALVSSLSIGQQQLVEIAKALSINAKVLIMDEPTSSLSAQETQRLFTVVNDLRDRGVSIIYISHRLGEVKELADRVTVLRDGENAGDLHRDEIDHDAMVRLMVGRDVSQFYARKQHVPGEVMLQVEDLVTSAHPQHELNFSVRSGEIVGLSGLVGAGRTEMLQVLFGVDVALAGQIRVAGEVTDFSSPRDAIGAGIALVPEDRKAQGLVLGMSVTHNIGLPGLRRHQRPCGFRNGEQEDRDTEEMIRELRVRTPGPGQISQYLSGGNQQKVVIGKWLSLRPRVLLLDEPTRGIDVGARQEIYALMEDLAAKGVAVLFVSSEMEEILGMSDRTLVMHEGRISGELLRDELSEQAVMHLATGGSAA